MAKSVPRWHAVRCVGESASSSSGSSFEKRHAELFHLQLQSGLAGAQHRVLSKFGLDIVLVHCGRRGDGRLVADTK